jgi:hypothetical protein
MSLSCSLGLGLMSSVHGDTTPPPTAPTMERVEVLIGNVFVPDVGYEDKNNIEVTLDGYLQNSCYQLADTQIAQGSDPYTVIIHQFADLRTDGVCSDPANIPVQMRDNIPYTLNVSLGHLTAGNYKILFNQGSFPERQSTFNVAPATTMAVDDFPYAFVSSLNMPDVVVGTHAVTVTLVGTLANTCQFVKEVKVLPELNVNTIVVLPILGYRTGRMCAQIVLPYEYKVNLGKLGEGRYLLHVRSQNGQAVTRVFSVIMPDPS